MTTDRGLWDLYAEACTCHDADEPCVQHGPELASQMVIQITADVDAHDKPMLERELVVKSFGELRDVLDELMRVGVKPRFTASGGGGLNGGTAVQPVQHEADAGR